MNGVIRCSRCDRRLRGNADAWNGEFRAGKLVAVICPSCQSTDENLEAAINDATLDYGVKVEDGKLRVAGHAKGGNR